MSNPFDYGGLGPGSPGAHPTSSGPSPTPFSGPPTAADPFGAPGPVNPFGSTTSAFRQTEPPARGMSPTIWLVVGLVLAVVAVAVAALFGGAIAVAAACWLVAGPIVIGLLAVFTRRETLERARPFSNPPSAGSRLLYGLVVVAALAGVVVSAFRIAEWVGRL